MSIYRAGTITVTLGSASVTGTGTAFLANVKAGDTLYTNNRSMVIKSAQSATAFTLELPWGGATATNTADYAIGRGSAWASNAAVHQRMDAILDELMSAAWAGHPGSKANPHATTLVQALDAQDLTGQSAEAAFRARLPRKYAFTALKNTNQAGVAADTLTKVTFDGETYDIGNYFNPATNRWTPPAGTVLMTASVHIGGVVSGGAVRCVIYKNGSAFRGGLLVYSGSSSNSTPIASVMDETDGTNYYEVYALAGGAGDKVFSSLSSSTYFQGAVL